MLSVAFDVLDACKCGYASAGRCVRCTSTCSGVVLYKKDGMCLVARDSVNWGAIGRGVRSAEGKETVPDTGGGWVVCFFGEMG